MEDNSMLVRINEKDNPIIRVKSPLTTISKNPVQNIAIKIAKPNLTKILSLMPKIKTVTTNKILLIIITLNKKMA